MSLNPYVALRNLARYQFGIEIGNALFDEELFNKMIVKRSSRTGRLRYVFLENKPYVSIRTSDGFMTLSLLAAREILEKVKDPEILVVVFNDQVNYILKSKEVLARQVKSANPHLKAGNEAIVVDENRNLVGVGRAVINGNEMLEIKRGVVIKLRKVVRNVQKGP